MNVNEREKLTKMIENGYVLLPRLSVTEKNNFVSIAKGIYYRFGIEVIEDYNNIFHMVKLPYGWHLKASEEEGISLLIDDKEITRGSIKYEYGDLNVVISALFEEC